MFVPQNPMGQSKGGGQLEIDQEHSYQMEPKGQPDEPKT